MNKDRAECPCCGAHELVSGGEYVSYVADGEIETDDEEYKGVVAGVLSEITCVSCGKVWTDVSDFCYNYNHKFRKEESVEDGGGCRNFAASLCGMNGAQAMISAIEFGLGVPLTFEQKANVVIAYEEGNKIREEEEN